ncbi:MAG: HDOD domain-containing protein [Candidatus Gastranaerophilaceae bacterium]
MITIGYVSSNNINKTTATKDINNQINDIKNFCSTHKLELSKIYTEISTDNDTKPILLNIMSTFYGKDATILIQSSDVISLNADFKNWILDEFNRMNLKIIFLNHKLEELDKHKNIASITEKITNIPSLPEIINKSIELMQNDKTSVNDLAKIISNDIGLTARVLKLVNSAYYGFPKQISTIEQAISILGFTTLKGLIISASIFKMFSNKGNSSFDYKNFWKHSILVATTSNILIKQTGTDENENIFSAAFLHDIGKVIFAQYDWQSYSNVCKMDNLTDTELLKAEEHYCGLNHCEIANLVAYSWNLPDIFCDIISFHHNPQASQHYKKECQIVQLANIIIKDILDTTEFNIDNITLNLLENLNISGENINKTKEEVLKLLDNINNPDGFLI